MKKHILFFISVVLLVSLNGCFEGKKDVFEKNWRNDSNLEIIQTLVKHKIRNCGEFKYKANINYEHEYLVRCTRDGKNWQAYTVFTSSKDISGPFEINSLND